MNNETFREDRDPIIGIQTPWGTAQSVDKIAEGLFFISTPSHGGYWVSQERLGRMPLVLLTPSRFYTVGSQWFEEDVEAARVVLAFPDLFEPEAYEGAETTMEATHPAIMAAFRQGAGRRV